MAIKGNFSTFFVNLCFVYKNLYILKLIDIYFFTYAIFENTERNKIKIKIFYVYKCYNYYRYFFSIIYMNFVKKIKRKKK